MELCRDISFVEMVVGYLVRRGGDLRFVVQYKAEKSENVGVRLRPHRA